MIGDKSVVTWTMITTGAKKTSDNNPTEIPFYATINATSPRHTIPATICTDSHIIYFHNNAPTPHPAIFEITAITHKMIVKMINVCVIP